MTLTQLSGKSDDSFNDGESAKQATEYDVWDQRVTLRPPPYKGAFAKYVKGIGIGDEMFDKYTSSELLGFIHKGSCSYRCSRIETFFLTVVRARVFVCYRRA